ncbi:MAG: DUF2202 domain-containing protein [bacterium]
MKPFYSALGAGLLGSLLLGCNASSSNSAALLEVDDSGYSSISSSQLETQLNALPLGEISAAEEAGLYFMREEEKLAHDVYSKLYDQEGQKVFDNIANSESTHTEAVKSLIDRYQLTDPVGSNDEGVFSDPVLQGLYDALIAQGSASLVDALLVGAAIEEIDIIDIESRKLEIVDNEDIVLVYDNLIKGSRNHLRAFVSNLENQGIQYTPQYLDQKVYNDVISGGLEQ